MAKKKTMQLEMNTLHLPSELLTEILMRLPVKFLIPFKCVSKSWFSLISDPNFANLHFQTTSASRILFISHQYPSTIKFNFIDFEINGNPTPPNHDFLLSRPPHSHYQIMGSCKGFIFLHRNIDICIWNPSSGIHKQIALSPFDSKLRCLREHQLYGLGYDQSKDDYLVVILTYDHIDNRTSHLEFFSLRDNMWNEIEGTPFTYLGMRGRNFGSFINGAIHWLAAKSCDIPVNDIIVAYDLIERKLFEMPLPIDFHSYRGYYSFRLWVFEEFLSLFAIDSKNHIEIWVMKEYKQHSSWTKTIVIRNDHHIPFFKPIYGTKSGDIIGKDGNRLVKYNGKGQLLEYLPIDPYIQEVILYTESLFLLPGYMS